MATLVRTILHGGLRFGLRLRLRLYRGLHGLGRSFHSTGSGGACRSCRGRSGASSGKRHGAHRFLRAGGAAFGWAAEPVVVGATVVVAPVVGATVFGATVVGVPVVVALAPGATVPGEAVPGTAPFAAFSGLGGTVGRRSAKISMARAAPAWPGSACLSSILVTTRTSSNRLRSAAGRTRMLRKSSLPGDTLVT